MVSYTMYQGVFLLALLSPALASQSRRDGFRHAMEAYYFPSTLHSSLDEALHCAAEGCFTETVPEHLEEVQAALLPLWRSLPKNSNGRVSWRMLRRLAHRHFLQRSSVMLRGFEVTRQINSTDRGLPDVLDGRVEAAFKELLGSRPAAEYGFSLEDAVRVVALLERLVFDAQTGLLEQAYDSWDAPTTGINRGQLMVILEEYIVRWLMGKDKNGIRLLLLSPHLRNDTFPHWHKLLDFAEGQTKALRYSRQKRPLMHRESGIMEVGYTFEDAHEIVGGITRSFASFWESQCTIMKNALFAMDKQHTGRAPVASFYAAALESEWHFVESEAYLRELGALDESSKEKGNQVIIPNYVQAAPNCIVTTDEYFVCCRNECEDIFADIEAAIGSPMAKPQQILDVVGNMSSQETLDDDFAPPVEGSLRAQLDTIAQQHGGEVPLHGRLFAQWLHYLYPHQCPFPHKMGHASMLSPAEYGEKASMTNEEIKSLIQSLSATTFPSDNLSASEANAAAMLSREGVEWMSQWSSEEELLMEDFADDLALLEEGGCILAGGVVVLILGMLGVFRYFRKAGSLELPVAKKHAF